MKKQKFSLVELLITIAIIAILIAMLLPVLKKATDAANASLCRSNLKQSMLAQQQYANDYNGFMLGFTARPGDGAGWHWPWVFCDLSYLTAPVVQCPLSPNSYSYKAARYTFAENKTAYQSV